MQWWQQPFFQVALPIIVTFVLATWYQSSRISDIQKRIDDLREHLGKRLDDFRSDVSARFNDVSARFTAIEKRLDRLEVKVEALQERSWC